MATPVNVVSSAYLVSQMARPVKLSNGWLIGAAFDSAGTRIYIYKSSDNGNTWSQLCYKQISQTSTNFSLASKGTNVYLLYTNGTPLVIVRFDASTVANVDLTGATQIETQTTQGANTAGITPDGNTLWWGASTKNATYPNSFNIRAGSIPINADGTLGTPGAVTQVTTTNSSGTDTKNPSVVIKDDGNPVILCDFNTGTTTNYIRSYVYNGSSFTLANVANFNGYPQSSPQAITTPNGKMHVVWHGKDSTNTTTDFIRYSNSADGTAWGTPKKLVQGTNATLTSDKNGKLIIAYEDGGYIKRIESTDEFATWTAPVTVETGTKPTSLYDPTFTTDFIIPPTIYQTSTAVRYYGQLNSNPTLTLTSPSDNQTLTDGNCEDTSKFTYTGGTAALDTTRKTQGNSSIKVTRNAANSYMTPTLTSIRPSVGDCYISIVDVYLENAAQANYIAGNGSEVTRNEKYVTATSGSNYSTTTTGQFIPIITAFQVTAVTTPGTSYFRPRLFNDGAIGQSYNVDSWRVFKITQAQYDALGTSVDLTTARQIASQYPYYDPEDVQKLVEGNAYVIAGSATEADSGNVVTVKYKIDDGTAYSITASVSDGTTPINFSKTLTYLNNRLYDGQNPVTPILEENVTHKLTVWAEDDKGGKSPDSTRNFKVLYNQPPQISGSDQDLGTITVPPSINYTVTDIEGYTFTVTEAVDGTTIRSYPGVDGQQETVTIPNDMWINLEPGVTHHLTITATDQYNATSTRTYTFKRAVDGIELATTSILPADAQPTRTILSLNGVIPDGSVLNVQVCNNAHDVSPTWEDMTQSVINGRPYVFTNTTSTSGQWGIRFKISILPGG